MSLTASQSDGSPTISERQRPQKNERELGTLEYEILPWKKRATLNAIDKCITASFCAVSLLQADSGLAPGVATIALRLKANLEKLNIVGILKGTKPQSDEITRRRNADGFRIEHRLLVKSKSWTRISTADVRVLVAHNILRTESAPMQ
jgi:hypothetical protein